jgi:hypothetical protein
MEGVEVLLPFMTNSKRVLRVSQKVFERLTTEGSMTFEEMEREFGVK